MLKVAQYREIHSEGVEGLFEKMIHLVSIIQDLDPLDVQHWKPNRLIEAYTDAQKKAALTERYSETISISGVDLHLIDSSKFTLMQFINLEEYVSESFDLNLHKIAATLYLSQTKGGIFEDTIEPYRNVNVDYRANLIDEMPVNQIYGACKKYLKFRETFFDSYELFKDPFEGVDVNNLTDEERIEYEKEIKEREKQSSNQWLTMLNILSDGDVTKFDSILDSNLFLTFNQLSYKKSNKT
jgi:hypothetical protein